MTPGPGIEPGPHWWEASALTTAPSLLPDSIVTFHSNLEPIVCFSTGQQQGGASALGT